MGEAKNWVAMTLDYLKAYLLGVVLNPAAIIFIVVNSLGSPPDVFMIVGTVYYVLLVVMIGSA